MLACPAVLASASSCFLLCVRGAWEQPCNLCKTSELFISRQLTQGWKCVPSVHMRELGEVMGNHGFGVTHWPYGRARSKSSGWSLGPEVGSWRRKVVSSFCRARSLCSILAFHLDSVTPGREVKWQCFSLTLIAWVAAAIWPFERNLLDWPFSFPPFQCPGQCACFPAQFPL